MGNSFGKTYIKDSSCSLCHRNFDPVEANQHCYSYEHIHNFLEKHVPRHLQVLNPCLVSNITIVIQFINSNVAPADSTETTAHIGLQLLFILLYSNSFKQAAMSSSKPKKVSSTSREKALPLARERLQRLSLTQDIGSYDDKRMNLTRTRLGLSDVGVAVEPNATHSRSAEKRSAARDTEGSGSNTANSKIRKKNVESILLLRLVREISALRHLLGRFADPIDELLTDLIANKNTPNDPECCTLLSDVRTQLGQSRGLVDPLGHEGDVVFRIIRNIGTLFYLQSMLFPTSNSEE